MSTLGPKDIERRQTKSIDTVNTGAHETGRRQTIE